jgi:hypothetical protein
MQTQPLGDAAGKADGVPASTRKWSTLQKKSHEEQPLDNPNVVCVDEVQTNEFFAPVEKGFNRRRLVPRTEVRELSTESKNSVESTLEDYRPRISAWTPEP